MYKKSHTLGVASVRRPLAPRRHGNGNARHGKRNRSPASYEDRYPEDRLGAELDEDARVWRVYQDEATKFDTEVVGRWRDQLDVLLVFAGLFASLEATFIAQFYTMVSQPDYGQISITLLAHLYNQELVASGQQPIALDPSLRLSNIGKLPPRDPRSMAALALAASSLLLAVGCSLTCVVVRQWLDFYTTPISAPPRTAALLRHQRFLALKRWGVGGFVHALPILIEVAGLLFLLSVILFTASSSSILFILIVIFGSGFFFLCMGSFALPLFDPRCPYVTPMTMYLSFLRDALKKKGKAWYSRQSYAKIFSFGQHFLPHGVVFRLSEEDIVQRDVEDLAASALMWLRVAGGESDASVNKIILQSLAGEIRANPNQSTGSTESASAFHVKLLGKCHFHIEALTELEHYIQSLQPPSETLTVEQLLDEMRTDGDAWLLYQACKAFARVDKDTENKLDTLLHRGSVLSATQPVVQDRSEESASPGKRQFELSTWRRSIAKQPLAGGSAAWAFPKSEGGNSSPLPPGAV